ncbi:Serine protease 27 [Bagarius yarrelli]|uniref:chymotrypsin n=1 Tax=Bagarius yarrelli TaxID=175774 RepID=A0A556V6H8_BAGYA|nr:Serine protease 27 [Bagarius yarrelli]
MSRYVVCGVAPLNTRVVGGYSASDGIWPWMASLQEGGSHFCGGSLINEFWVLTAAQCVSGKKPSDLVVYLGKTTLEGSNPHEIKKRVLKIRIHPSYDPQTKENDIALLRLQQKVTFTDYIRPVCLASQDSVFPESNLCWLTGWGNVKTNVYGVATLNTGNINEGDASDGFWPWMASLQEGGSHFCGGSLINEFWVLTAAQCVSGKKPSDLVVYLGKTTLEGSNPHEIKKRVLKIRIHPSYDPQTKENDIALLRLQQKVTFTDYIRPVCLASQDSVLDSTSWLTGWGDINTNVCGVAPLNSPIVGGNDAADGDWPWQVSLRISGSHFCGGSLINDNWVMTAAHCILSSFVDPRKVDVHLGKQSLQNTNRNVVSRIVKRFISHPGYNKINNDNDIALLHLTATVKYTDYIRPVCLPSHKSYFPAVCGTAPLNTRIVGGADAQEGSWPWQASLQKSGKHFCGGTLINKDWVMTAAHCAAGLSTTGLLVYLGKRTLIGTNQYEVSRSVSRIISHPKYNSRTIDYDIALMNLKSEVTFTNYIRPVCLASKTSVFPDGTISWISGWGNINYGVSLPSPGVLQEAQVPIVENVRCGTLMKPYSITQNMICAGYAEGGTGTCQGDSGGPLVSKQNLIWVQAGITSWGVGCAQPNKPAVYARVSQFQDWITSIVKVNLPGFVTF